MSCTNPRCALVPFGGGSPKFLSDDYPAGSCPLGRIVYIPCGGCLACRRERRQDLTVLQMCEASMSDDSWFLTLTYDDDKYRHYFDQEVYSLEKKHLQSFCESMRKYCSHIGKRFRFYACGEYGERYLRPHYHLSIFNLTADDLCLSDDLSFDYRRRSVLVKGSFSKVPTPQVDSNGNSFWQSSVIQFRWPYGNHKLYRANRETFQYVAGYVTKKLTGDAGKEFRSTGRVSEFSLQSRPSIGYPFFIKYKDNLSLIDLDSLINDSVDIGDISWRVPRIMDKWRVRLEGDHSMNMIKKVRSSGSPEVPDRIDLKRKADFDRYSAKRYQDTNRSHKEIQ